MFFDIGKRIEVIFFDDSQKAETANNRIQKIRDLRGKISFDDNALSTARRDSIL